MGSNLMAVDRRLHVLETSLTTSAAALEDPAHLPHLTEPPDTDHADDDWSSPHLGQAG
jgi:hypothetical protein